MVTMNYTGSEKSKLLVIGKSAKPRGFPQNMKHFPVNYESNKTAWMTADIWSRYLMSWDAKLRIEGRFILLLADNAPGHKEVTLTNIHVEYMPKNTTAAGCYPDS